MSYADVLAKTYCENTESTACTRRISSSVLVARMKEERLPKKTLFVELVNDKGCAGGEEK